MTSLTDTGWHPHAEGNDSLHVNFKTLLHRFTVYGMGTQLREARDENS
jgi:hypothetical protein